jgi:hypothetical protein
LKLISKIIAENRLNLPCQTSGLKQKKWPPEAIKYKRSSITYIRIFPNLSENHAEKY